jgi:hypothetical protein
MAVKRKAANGGRGSQTAVLPVGKRGCWHKRTSIAVVLGR